MLSPYCVLLLLFQSPEAVIADCTRIAKVDTVLPGEAIASLVANCRKLLTNEAVAAAFCTAVWKMLNTSSSEANAATCDDSVVQLILDFMSAHPDAENVAADATCALLNLTVCKEEHTQTIVLLKGLPILCTALERHIASPVVSRFATGVVWSCASKDSSRATVLSAGCLARVNAAMDRHLTVMDMQWRGCGALRAIASTQAGKAAVVKSDGVNRVKRAMAAHPDEAKLQTKGADLLDVLGPRDVIAECTRMNGLTGAVAASVIKNLAVMMEPLYEEHESVAKAYCETIWTVCRDSAANKTACGEAVIQRVLACMNAHPNSAVVQQHAACAFHNLLASCDPNKRSFMRKNGLSALYVAVARHGESAEFMRFVVGVTWFCAECTDTRAAVLSGNGVAVVNRAMDRHTDSADLQWRACNALSAMAATLEGKAEVVSSGGISRVNRAKTRHPADAHLTKQVPETLKILGPGREADVTAECTRLGDTAAAIDVKALDVINTLVRQLVKDEGVTTAYCTAVWKVCNNSAAAANATTCGATVLQLVLDSMSAHAASQPLNVQATCACLNMLVRSDRNIPTLVRLKGLTVLNTIADKHVQSAEVCRYLLGVVSYCAWYEETRAAVLASGILNRVYAAMDHHSAHPEVQWRGCRVLWNLARSFEGRAAVGSTRGGDRARVARIKFASNETVVSHAEDVEAMVGPGGDVVALCKTVGETSEPVQRDAIENITMYTHRAMDTEAVVKAYCSAIDEVCRGRNASRNRVVCGDTVVQLLLDCMVAHPDGTVLQESILLACLNVMIGSEANQRAFTRLGGLHHLYNIGDRHIVSSLKFARRMCGITWECAFSEDSRGVVIDAGAVTRVIVAMDSHPDDADLQWRACGALRNITQSAEGKVAVWSAGGVDRLTRAKTRHADHAKLKEQVDAALRSLEDAAEIIASASSRKSGVASPAKRGPVPAPAVPGAEAAPAGAAGGGGGGGGGGPVC